MQSLIITSIFSWSHYPAFKRRFLPNNDSPSAGPPLAPKPFNVGSTSIGVCVEPVSALRRSQVPQLVEWLELLRILGADRVTLYHYNVDEAAWRALEHYSAERGGFLEHFPVTLAGPFAS